MASRHWGGKQPLAHQPSAGSQQWQPDMPECPRNPASPLCYHAAARRVLVKMAKAERASFVLLDLGPHTDMLHKASLTPSSRQHHTPRHP